LRVYGSGKALLLGWNNLIGIEVEERFSKGFAVGEFLVAEDFCLLIVSDFTVYVSTEFRKDDSPAVGVGSMTIGFEVDVA